VIGCIDDLIIVPLGIAAVLRLVPADVLADCREQAQMRTERRVSWIGVAFMVTVWLLAATWLVLVVRDFLTWSEGGRHMAGRVRLVAWLLLVLLALFPILAAIADLVSDFGTGLPTDHQATFAAVAGQE
jgi:hypothetical protein